MTNREAHMTNEVEIEVCGCCGAELDEYAHEIGGEAICFDCYEHEMDEALFGDPFGEW